MSTEIPAYRVAQHEGDIEIREYPALVAAEVSVGGDRNSAVREGFRLLAGYIFGGNDGGRRIDRCGTSTRAESKTAPVERF